MTCAVRKLTTRAVEKVWGRDRLPCPFECGEGRRIGEIWFEPPAELPDLLVKYLFTSEKLSVQVHPSDTDALSGEDGKEECWLVLDAEPGAKLAIGFDDEYAPDAVAAAARDGSIEDMLTWHDAKAGDVFFLPPGTVHAIGPGLALVEVQQNSDTTFRLYDYGRPRDLHLARAMAVARLAPYDRALMTKVGGDAEAGEDRASENGAGVLPLASGDNFCIDRVVGVPDKATVSAYDGPLLALPLEGELRAANGSKQSARAGECLYARSIAALDFAAAGVTLLTRPHARG